MIRPVSMKGLLVVPTVVSFDEKHDGSDETCVSVVGSSQVYWVRTDCLSTHLGASWSAITFNAGFAEIERENWLSVFEGRRR